MSYSPYKKLKDLGVPSNNLPEPSTQLEEIVNSENRQGDDDLIARLNALESRIEGVEMRLHAHEESHISSSIWSDIIETMWCDFKREYKHALFGAAVGLFFRFM